MARRRPGPARDLIRRALAALALIVLAAGLAAQAALVAREARRQLSAGTSHPLRDLLQAADRRIPPGAGYAVTSPVRADNARYFLYPRQPRVVGFSRAALERSGVRFVIVTDDARPPALRGRPGWFRVLLQMPAGRLIEVTG